MKKIYAYLGIALAATISLSSCTKQIESPVTPEQDGTPFEVSALLTKTTNDGYTTKWAESDGINIFHAEAGATIYTPDNEFTLSDATTGTFKGTLDGTLDDTKNYDWYAFYPYSSYNKTPAGKDKDTFGYTTIGGTSQTQTGNNSTAHLSGKACPLYGVTTGVAASAVPNFTMQNLTSVVCVEVTNSGTDDLTVGSIAFTSTEDIVGTYYIDFTGTTPTFTKSGDSYVSSTASLTVTGGAAITAGNSARFYIAIKPHTVASGATLKMSVNGQEKTTIVSKNTVFEAGKIKTVKFSAAGTGEKVIYECGFESSEGFTTGTNYQGTVKSGESGKQWQVYYGNFSTSGKINGDNSLAMRRYKSNSYLGYAQMEFDLPKVTTVSYKAKAATSNGAKLLLNTFYSTDSGSTWVAVDTDKALTTSAADYSFAISTTGEYANVRIKFAISANSTAPTSGNAQLTIDDITVRGK